MKPQFQQRLMFLLENPSEKMRAAGMGAILESAVVEHVSIRAPDDILKAMVKVALEEADG